MPEERMTDERLQFFIAGFEARNIAEDQELVAEILRIRAAELRLERVSKNWAEACQKNYEKYCDELNKRVRLEKEIAEIKQDNKK